MQSNFREETAHPRSRGEHWLLFSVIVGLSWLIPARAGNTSSSGDQSARWSAHPRSRGEHFGDGGVNQRESGSSPLARGTRLNRPASRRGLRLIPARAGNTCGAGSACVEEAAHPRSRGEHSTLESTGWERRGSSPLARGTQLRHHAPGYPARLIPARAGNTRWAASPLSPPTAHPRSRGEHAESARTTGMALGSSPLARGTHLLTWGFTPYISKIESLWSQSLHPEYTISSRY